MCVLVRIDVAGISACQNSENGKLARSLVTQRRHFIERHYIVDRRPVLVLIDPFTEVKVQSKDKTRTAFSVLGGFNRGWPPYHQARASHDAVLMRMHDAAIHRRDVAKIFGNISGSTAMSLVIALDRLESSQDLVHRVKGEQPLPCWKDRAEAGVLSDNWSARREIAGTAITKPSSPQAHVCILSHSKL